MPTPSYRRFVALCSGVLALAAGTARAAVERVEILSRSPCAAVCGAAPGTEPYEELHGRATFALDPDAPANARITDLKNAPRDARGRVVFSTDFLVRRPVHANADPTLLYDVNNRGEPIADSLDWAVETGGAKFHNTSFLARHGFTIVSSAWAWDVMPSKDDEEPPLVFTPPIASNHGRPITGKVANEFVVEAAVPETAFVGINGRAYHWAVSDDPAAVLTARERPENARVPFPRNAWRIIPSRDGAAPTRIALEGGFKPGLIYELSYVARDPYVVAAGPIAIRDLLSWLRANPLDGAPAPRHTLLFGDSQTGRLIQQMLYEGFDLDEQGRKVFDGALDVVAGAGRGGFNTRFGFPTRASTLVVDRSYPTDIFPFATGPTRDQDGKAASLFDRARATDGSAPKLFIVNKSTEFWERAASLLQTTPDGKADAAQDPNARLYLLAGTQHFPGGAPERAPLVNCTDSIMELPYLRAMLLNLDDWVRGKASPPPSAYPRVAGGGLVTLEEYDRLFPKGIGLTPPSAVYAPQRMNFGPRYAATGIIDQLPPTGGMPYGVRVPRPDRDGTDVGGVRPVEIIAPLGTYTGWNQMAEATGFGWALDRFQGSFQPFARTVAERKTAADPRPSLEERYPTRAAFAAAALTAAIQAVSDRTLLAEDVDGVVGAQVAFYDRVIARAADDVSCKYLRPERRAQ